MAKLTRTLSRSGAWVELTAGVVPATLMFDNRGPASILVQYNITAAPAAGDNGILFKPGQGDRPSAASRCWARVELADASVGSDATVYVETT